MLLIMCSLLISGTSWISLRKKRETLPKIVESISKLISIASGPEAAGEVAKLSPETKTGFAVIRWYKTKAGVHSAQNPHARRGGFFVRMCTSFSLSPKTPFLPEKKIFLEQF